MQRRENSNLSSTPHTVLILQEIASRYTSICYGSLFATFDEGDNEETEVDQNKPPRPQCVHKIQSKMKVSDLQRCQHATLMTQNPLKNAEVETYVTRQWKGCSPLYGSAILKWAEISRGIHFVRSNQLSEAKFKDWKSDGQYKLHCQSPATMAQYWWNRAIKDDWNYIHQMESVKQIVQTSEVRFQRATTTDNNSFTPTQLCEISEEREDVGFRRRSTDSKMMAMLANNLSRPLAVCVLTLVF